MTSQPAPPVAASPAEILDFWFHTDHGEDLSAWREQVMAWFRGGMDEAIAARFGPTWEAAARGALHHWAETPRGRLALILVLDQLPRSLFRDDPRAFSTDADALAVAQEGIAIGHFDALDTGWERLFYGMPMTHAEGPDHLARFDWAIAQADRWHATGPVALRPLLDFNRRQPRRGREVIARFGRFPHRNQILGRESTAEERAWLAETVLPHLTPLPGEGVDD